MTRPREIAESLIATLKAQHAPDTITLVEESGFPHLDMSAYHQVRRDLESHAYRYLGDIEIAPTATLSGQYVGPPMIRCMLSGDGGIGAIYYQLREIAARGAATHHLYDFLSELENTFVLTSNASAAGTFNSPPSFDIAFLPQDTSLDTVRSAHESRLATARARTGAEPTSMVSLDDVLAMEARVKRAKYTYREASGWITLDELIALTRGNRPIAEGIFREVQLILQQS